MSEGADRAAGDGRPIGSCASVPEAVASAPGATGISRVVAGVALSGVLAVAATAWFGGDAGGPVVALGWLDGAALVAGLVGMTCLSELVAVRLRHRDAVEELTLLDPMLVIVMLLLPPLTGLAVGLSGLALAYALRRRALIKVIFNLGTYATGGAVLGLCLRGVAGPSPGFDLQLLVAIAAASAGFVAVNVVSMSLLLSRLAGGGVLALILEDLRLTGITVTVTGAMAATTLTVAVHSPSFLPCIVLPAVAIHYAYRATATAAEQRERSAHALAFSRVLAGGPTRQAAVTAFLRLAGDGFLAVHALAVFTTGEVVDLHDAALDAPEAADDSAGHDPAGADPRRVEWLTRCRDGAALLDTGLPPGWRQALVAPLEADGTRLGVVVVGWEDADRRRAGEVTMFSSLASSLAVALSRASHLARLVEETGKLRAVVDQSSDGILVLDGLGRVTVWNPAMAGLTGLDAADVVGRELGCMIDSRGADGERVDAFGAGRRLLSERTPQASVELQLVRPDGQWRAVRCAHAGIFDSDGELIRDVVNVHDLTRERQVERLKSDFIATVSHELRTPVTPIKGYSELLRRRWETLPEDKRVKALDVIVDRAAHLGRLVEDLLLASRISADGEHGACEPERSVVMGQAELNALMVRAAEDFTGDAARLLLHPAADPVPVHCDSTRAVQVLTNLLSNALKYSPAGSPVEVEVRRDGDDGVVSVRDRGRGIPGDQVEWVFEKFHRVEDPMVMSTSGTGLGLFIARQLARGMGGDVTLMSVPGEGSTFALRLRLASRDVAVGRDVAVPGHAAAPSAVTGTAGPAGPA